MDSIRFILVLSLALVVMLLWDAWQRDYGSPPPQNLSAESDSPVKTADIPQLPEETVSTAPEKHIRPAVTAQAITVKTDLFNIKIDTKGGNIIDAELLKFPLSINAPDKPVHLLTENHDLVYIIQGGIISNNNAPTHATAYTSSQNVYMLAPGQQSIRVPLYWHDDSGLMIIKSYEFFRDKYLIKVSYEISNNNNSTWSGRAYGQIQRTHAPKRSSGMVYTYTGAIISSPEKRYEKISFEDMQDEKISRSITNGWAAMIMHYFVTAFIPGSTHEEYRYYSLYLDKKNSGLEQDRYVIGGSGPPVTVKAGEKGVLQYSLYVGPKIQKRLEQLAPGLELTVDYGVLWFIAKPLFWCLQKFHTVTGNWGWSIVLVTLMLKLLFYNLSAAGYRSMANMRRVQPRLLAIRDRYKNDKARLNKAMMDLYKQEKINPLGGCFPILVQIPVFIALYWVLLESVELRQSGFVLWIKDLSTPDPYFVLPLIMGVTMFIQQKLNPAPMDPVQEKVMMMLPFIFTVFFAFFPSGLVLYWVANNILSIAQQWMITRNLERAEIKS
jgi:YidC/Oxa1 family membrane protein insertase